MRGWKRYTWFAGVALLLIAGVAGRIFLLADRSPPSPSSPQPVPADEPPAEPPIVIDLGAVFRNVDARGIRTLLDTGTDVNACDAQGNTPLILASFYASPECVELLIEKGADVNAANRAGRHGARPGRDELRENALARARRSERPGANGPRQHAADPGGPPRRQFPNRPVVARSRRRPRTERSDAGVSPIISAAASEDVETGAAVAGCGREGR